MTQLNT